MAVSQDIPRNFHLLPKDGSKTKKTTAEGKTSKSRCFTFRPENKQRDDYNPSHVIVKSGNREDAVEFIKDALEGFKCKNEPDCGYGGDGGSFHCDVSFYDTNSEKPVMSLSYRHRYRGGSICFGGMTVIAHELDIYDLQDVLLSSGLERLCLSGVKSLDSDVLIGFGKRMAAEMSLKILEVEEKISRKVAYMLGLVLKETKSLEILDLSKILTNKYGGDAKKYIDNSLQDGFRNNQSTLRHLNLSGCTSPETLLAILNGLNENTYPPSLRVLDFSECRYKKKRTKQIMNAIGTVLKKEDCKLRTLKLNGLIPGIAEDDPGSLDITHISKALSANTSLVTIDVSVNYLNSIGIETLMESLKVNKTLETITMRGMSYRSYGRPAARMPDGFHTTESCLAPSGWRQLFTGLADTKGLKELDLNSNKIDPDTISLLAEVLTKDHSLRKLCLRETFEKGNVNGTKLLVRALKCNRSLRELDFQYNHCFDNEVMDQLVLSLSTNRTLEKLSLNSCGLDKDQLHVFASHLSKMQGLKRISIGHNDIDRNVATICLDEVKQHFGLESLHMATSWSAVPGRVTYYYSDFDDIYQQIEFFLKLNRYRKVFLDTSSSSSSSSNAKFLILEEYGEDLGSLLYCFLVEKYIVVERFS